MVFLYSFIKIAGMFFDIKLYPVQNTMNWVNDGVLFAIHISLFTAFD